MHYHVARRISAESRFWRVIIEFDEQRTGRAAREHQGDTEQAQGPGYRTSSVFRAFHDRPRYLITSIFGERGAHQAAVLQPEDDAVFAPVEDFAADGYRLASLPTRTDLHLCRGTRRAADPLVSGIEGGSFEMNSEELVSGGPVETLRRLRLTSPTVLCGRNLRLRRRRRDFASNISSQRRRRRRHGFADIRMESE